MFATREDEDLKMLPPGPAPEHLTPAPSSASGHACSHSDPFAGLYIRTAKLVQGIPIVTSALRPFVGASSSSSSTSSLSRDSSEDYPEIRVSAYKNSTDDGCLILMVAPDGDRACNSSSGYPTIGRSEASDAQTPSVGLVRNLNPDFNVIRVQVIMETIQRMAHDGSPLALLAQQGAEATNIIVAEKSTGVPRGEPFVGRNNRAGRARSEAASSASPKRHLSKHNACHRRSEWPPQHHRRSEAYLRQNTKSTIVSPNKGVTPTGRTGFRALAGPLREVRSSAKFKAGHID
jgi:hypothetical protein